MIFSRFLNAAVLAAALGLSACQSSPESGVETLATALPPATTASENQASSAIELDISTPPPPTDAATTRWLETQQNGIRLGMWRPDGWETDVSDGLVLAEYDTTSGGTAESGMLVYVFVPQMGEFAVSDDDTNFAWTVLNQVVQMPSHTGHDVAVSQPVGFKWDDYHAAYYLLSTGDGVRMLVLALAIPNERKVVVCTVSAAAAQSSRIRAALPWLLNGLMIDGKPLRGASLDMLPDPLPFPRYHRAPTPVDNRSAANGSP